jgi:hypothetical protein
MNLLLGSLVLAIQELARSKGLRGYRVDYKRNVKGELVIALIVTEKEGPLSPASCPVP